MPAKKAVAKKVTKKAAKPAKKAAAKKPAKKAVKKPAKKVVKKAAKKQEPAKDVVVAPVVDTSGVVTMNPVPDDVAN